MSTFHCFPDLPPEIQAQICKINVLLDKPQLKYTLILGQGMSTSAVGG